MIGRISAQSTTSQFQRLNAAAEAKVQKFNQQIASGLAFENPSESPADTSLLLGNSRRLARIDQYSRNATSANQWLASTDQALQSANDSMTRARTLTVQGLNSGSGTDAGKAAAAEIRQIREQLIGTANTTQGGRAIFSGTAEAPAYDAAGVYQGDTGAVTRAIDTYEILQVNAVGPKVFGESNPTDPMNGSIFEQLSAIADALEAGDTATASQGLDAIDVVDAPRPHRTRQGRCLGEPSRVGPDPPRRRADLDSQPDLPDSRCRHGRSDHGSACGRDRLRSPHVDHGPHHEPQPPRLHALAVRSRSAIPNDKAPGLRSFCVTTTRSFARFGRQPGRSGHPSPRCHTAWPDVGGNPHTAWRASETEKRQQGR